MKTLTQNTKTELAIIPDTFSEKVKAALANTLRFEAKRQSFDSFQASVYMVTESSERLPLYQEFKKANI